MANLNTIINEYQDADASKRLYLFLECPDLRRRFMAVEHAEYQASALAAAQLKKRSWLSKCVSFFCSGEEKRPMAGCCCLKFKDGTES